MYPFASLKDNHGMSSAITKGLAMISLIIMLVLGATSMFGDSLTVDEDPHIGSGISYLTQKDMRLNPEHPPLMKDLAALPLLFVKDLKVPTEHRSWTEDINGQWDFGREFIFWAGNNANLVVFLSRIMPLVMTVILGWFVFKASLELAGAAGGLVAIILYTFSPVILAHGRLVTTDVPAALGAFVATYFLLKYLFKPSQKGLLIAGFAFGIAQLFKFSNFLLIPYFGVLCFAWLAIVIYKYRTPAIKGFFKLVGGTIAIGIIGYILVYIVYIWHIWNYPPERQLSDATHILATFGSRQMVDAVLAMTQISVLRPVAEYLLGLMMVLQRSVGGNTAFFMGEVARIAWKSYFPLVYFFKIPVPFHILTLLTVAMGFKAIFNRIKSNPFSISTQSFTVFAALLYIAIYSTSSILSNLNIGVRHLMPILPFAILLVSYGISLWLKSGNIPPLASLDRKLDLFKYYPKLGLKLLLILPLFIWYIGSTIIAWPHYIAWYNELAGFKGGGQAIAVDSNLDWGQDLRRLAEYVEKNNIDKIYFDYFGTAPAQYYLDEKFENWNPFQKKPRPSGWFAVSASIKSEGCATPTKGFDETRDHYCWLNDYNPVTAIGNSIYIYDLP